MASTTSVHCKPAITAYPACAWAQVATCWAKLVQSSDCSFFLTREWIETWLEVFGGRLEPTILVVDYAGETIGACLLVRNKLGMLSRKRIWVNASGESSLDTTYIEYNGLLAKAGWEVPVAQTLADYLGNEDWEELILNGFAEGPAYDTLKKTFSEVELSEVRHPSHYVDLAAIRQANGDYAGFLKGKNGKHLRQNLRYYANSGPLHLEIADSASCALAMLDELGDLSRKRWDTLGDRSIFFSAQFTLFHRKLIEKCFPLGAIQMVRVLAGVQTIGVVYNLVHRGKVCFYQCGYRYTSDKRLSPGRVTLSLVIQHCLEAGYDDFDFLSGRLKYKECMSMGSRTLSWSVFRRRGIKSQVLGVVRRIVGRS